jgi:hydroxymethylpyrimidine pyrophosphatase-like HAD family hydrolase
MMGAKKRALVPLVDQAPGIRANMRYVALATDFDETLASEGIVADRTLDGLRSLKASGRRLILVTGRFLSDMRRVFPHTDLFDCLVVENGAHLYYPATHEDDVRCDPPPDAFLSRLREMKVPFEPGRCIVATRVPYHTAILDAIRQLGLDLQVIFNKGAVMVLPSGINKATGLRAALHSLRFSLHNTVGVGDAENDLAFVSACACGVAVANALPALAERADIRTKNPNGAGVLEIIEQLLKDDLAQYDSQSPTAHEFPRRG